MKIYLKGGMEAAKDFALEWAKRNRRKLIVPKADGWHAVHSLDPEQFVYFLGEKLEEVDCDRCVLILHGHSHGGGYVKVGKDDETPLTLGDFVAGWESVIDLTDPVQALMKKWWTPKEIIGSYLYIDYLERNIL